MSETPEPYGTNTWGDGHVAPKTLQAERLEELERENDALARMLAHVSGAVTGHLKPAMMYLGKPLPPVEEALALYRAAQLLAERVVLAREGRQATEAEVFAELIWFVKVATKELPVPIPERKVPT